VSYNEKHNADNGEDNNDGHNDNRSYNYGEEGPTENPDIIATRERQKRNFLTTLLFSHGTPMLLAGDEFGRTQKGNNNGYCQDSEISWIDWKGSPKTTPRCASLPVVSLPFARNSRCCAVKAGATGWRSAGSMPEAVRSRPSSGMKAQRSGSPSAGRIFSRRTASGTTC
jgi:hypothetical protein